MKTEKKIIIALTICFFLLMTVFTFVSRYVTESELPLVKTIYPDYDMEVPAESLHSDEKGNYYVYAVKEIDTILGKRPAVMIIDVDLVKRNKTTVILDGIDVNFEVIVSSDQEISENMRIRKGTE